ncbi:DUF2293 domain-containing protein [Pelagicoccus sp. NFK12]|uniref:DUF2293 domain-containing protein n=1 Tax=Pelagicoccus enzymogenes TaxID=2773457 RepID=A0A927FBB7_9BACT|nr:DUF2293 domain-containing protein [Pelagicoccus enzymogenes]MBD5781719.1 DUF2293 domain-containing protein [Pelagicoccus enzymogenes]MDQ8200001.1 DUF2293 domain-containing protein [Pelagicoccus enzymogenes]
MPEQNREVRPHPHPRKVISHDGHILTLPDTWELLEPGDAALTRRVKAAGPTWTVKEKRGRRVISLGIWAAKESIETNRLKLLIERQDPSYKKRLQAGRERRAKQEANYAIDFRQEILAYLNFHSRYQALAEEMATRIAEHATPVGSGTVARTKRIPIEKRAEAATIAWMRHQTTAYDHMHIARVKGERREVRRRLAAQSKALLESYRRGRDSNAQSCPLQNALSNSRPHSADTPASPTQAEFSL